MKVRSKQQLISTTAERWKEQYTGKWYTLWRTQFNPEETYKKLKQLQNPTEEQIIEIIGNKSWTENICHECKQDKEVLIIIGEEPDYESNTASICPDCLMRAYILGYTHKTGRPPDTIKVT